MGDGGSGGDPNNNAQNKQVLLGKMLRININDTTSTTRYTIPSSNPFYGRPDSGRGEIFTWGMRNPWKYSQDPVTGLIYAGDVGQDAWEEVDIIQNGKNYGWRIMEGLACYNPPSGCDTTGLTKPIKVYGHTSGNCSITGGYVYRGSRRPELNGAFIYGDYCTGYIWMLRYANGIVGSDSLLTILQHPVSSFGVDQLNELYIVGYANGIIYRFNRSAVSSINNNQNLVPDKFELKQNYPNPFNPTTLIEYNLPEISNIKLVISDVLGRRVKTLVTSTQLSGNYKMLWNGTDDNGKSVSSGIYFYSLITDKFKTSKRMLLVK
jgi:hypothetical protein